MTYISGTVPGMAAYPDGALFVFGGTSDKDNKDPTALLASLWAFSLQRHCWQKVEPLGQAPAARQGHSMTSNGTQVGGEEGAAQPP
jgi:hypothetical protein